MVGKLESVRKHKTEGDQKLNRKQDLGSVRESGPVPGSGSAPCKSSPCGSIPGTGSGTVPETVPKTVQNEPMEADDADGVGAEVTCVDARNGFNKLSRMAMLWTVRHRWSKGSRFAFNCYRHACILIVHQDGDECLEILSEEGVTQGDPLAMILYGIDLIPLAEYIQAAVLSVLQIWYADSSAFAGKASGIKRCMEILIRMGPTHGYHLEPAKSISIGKPEHEARAKDILQEFNFQYTVGARYIGSFIGSEESQQARLQPKIDEWVENIKLFARAARKYSQTAFAGLTKSLQMECTYLQQVIPNVFAFFTPIK